MFRTRGIPTLPRVALSAVSVRRRKYAYIYIHKDSEYDLCSFPYRYRARSGYRLHTDGSGEFVDSQTAVIGTSTTVCHRSCIFQLVDLINGEHSRFCAFLMAFTGNQCSTEGTHDSGNIRTDGFTACNLFEASKNRIIVEGTTLYNDVLAKFGSVRNLDNLIQSILITE